MGDSNQQKNNGEIEIVTPIGASGRKIDGGLVTDADKATQKLAEGKTISAKEAAQIRADEILYGERPKPGEGERDLDMTKAGREEELGKREKRDGDAEKGKSKDLIGGLGDGTSEKDILDFISPKQERARFESFFKKPTKNSYQKMKEWVKTRPLVEGFLLRKKAREVIALETEIEKEKKWFADKRKEYEQKVAGMKEGREKLDRKYGEFLKAAEIDDLKEKMDEDIIRVEEKISALKEREREVDEKLQDHNFNKRKALEKIDVLLDKITVKLKEELNYAYDELAEVKQKRKELKGRLPALRSKRDMAEEILEKTKELESEKYVGKIAAQTRWIKKKKIEAQRDQKDAQREIEFIYSEMKTCDKHLDEIEERIDAIEGKIDAKGRKFKEIGIFDQREEEEKRQKKNEKQTTVNKGLAKENEVVNEAFDEVDDGWDDKMEQLRKEAKKDKDQEIEEERKRDKKAEARMAFWAEQGQKEKIKPKKKIKLENSSKSSEKQEKQKSLSFYLNSWNKNHKKLPVDIDFIASKVNLNKDVSPEEAKEYLLAALSGEYVKLGRAEKWLLEVLKKKSPEVVFFKSSLVNESLINEGRILLKLTKKQKEKVAGNDKDKGGSERKKGENPGGEIEEMAEKLTEKMIFKPLDFYIDIFNKKYGKKGKSSLRIKKEDFKIEHIIKDDDLKVDVSRSEARDLIVYYLEEKKKTMLSKEKIKKIEELKKLTPEDFFSVEQ